MSDLRTPDGLLLRRYRDGGDEAAFAELRRRHERLVFCACRRETGDATLAEDAAQAVFLLLTKKRFDDGASLAGWLFGAARLVSKNLVREEGRRIRRERRAFVEPEGADRVWDALEPHLNDALAGLRAGDREAILLRFVGERSLAEVGGALGIAENAARMRVARALERMRAHLRRAGVGVSAALLATLLSTRAANAAPAGGPPSVRGRRAAGRAEATMAVDAFVAPGVAIGGAALVLVGVLLSLGVLSPRPPRLGDDEAGRLLASAAGSWQGTLEFADDATGARTTTATTVAIDRPDGGLRVVARYPGYATADTTTFRPLSDGRYSVTNVGSHALDGTYDLVRVGAVPTFVGISPSLRTEVRLRLRTSADGVVLEEERLDGKEYRFRNRFDLKRL